MMNILRTLRTLALAAILLTSMQGIASASHADEATATIPGTTEGAATYALLVSCSTYAGSLPGLMVYSESNAHPGLQTQATTVDGEHVPSDRLEETTCPGSDVNGVIIQIRKAVGI